MTGRACVEVSAVDGDARAGTVHTTRGTFATPAFMPVGTRASVRTLASDDLEDLGVEVMLANTYHLMLRPGAGIVGGHGGLHKFMAWDRHVLTDSGGYQVFSLQPAVDDDGVTFKSTYDGSRHRLTPEGAVEVQELLGADIQMVLDVCLPYPAPPELVREAVERTAAWAARAAAVHRDHDQALFGIVQGGVDPVLRRESAARTVDIGFDGYGIGGLSVGEDRSLMLDALEAVMPTLPADRPRYLMGVGDPLGVIEAVARGVDMFDCVLPTRLARHGTILTGTGRFNLRNAVHLGSSDPLDPTCECRVCARWSRGYLAHLLRVNEPSAARLLTIHNLAWLLGTMRRARLAIAAGSFDRLRSEIAHYWA